MRTRWGIVLLALWIGIGLAPLASGDDPLPMFDIDFNGDTAGSVPATKLASSISLTEVNTQVTWRAGTSNCIVVSSFDTAGDSLSDKPVRMFRETTAYATPQLAMIFGTLPGLQLSNYQLEMDVLVDTYNAASGLTIYYYNNASPSNLIGTLRMNLTDFSISLIAAESGFTTFSNVWQLQETFRVGLLLDVTDRTLSALVDGVNLGSVPFLSEDLPGNLLTMGSVRIRTVSSNWIGDLAIDNITTSIIPEPGSLLLVTAGLLLFRMRRRRIPLAT